MIQITLSPFAWLQRWSAAPNSSRLPERRKGGDRYDPPPQLKGTASDSPQKHARKRAGVIGERDVGAVTRLTARHVARGLSRRRKKRGCSEKGSAMPPEAEIGPEGITKIVQFIVTQCASPDFLTRELRLLARYIQGRLARKRRGISR